MYQIPPDPVNPEAAASLKITANRSENKMTSQILIVDDDFAIKEAMHEYLELAGYQCATVSTAEEALEAMKSREMDVVITDIILPGMDGLELTDVIKKNYDTDIMVMTGYSGSYSYEEAINKGASDFVFKPVRFEELLLRLKRVLKERKLTQERVQMLKKLHKLAITDGLTKLYNLRHFYAQLELEVNRSNRYQHPLSLLLIDLDHFKEYNDSHGHLKGDEVLMRVGQKIRLCLRKMDTAYRYGGDEFTTILPETTGNEATSVAYRIREAIESEPFTPAPGKQVVITVTIGVTEYCPKEDLASLIQRADRAMYLTKQKGRNQVFLLFADQASSS